MGQMKVSRWGNSLAVRLPADVVRALGVREGDMIDSALLLNAAADADREQKRQAALERIRNTKWQLPPDYKFDREEANAR
jgi:antitoxin MazE